jgi:hypothetical protein
MTITAKYTGRCSVCGGAIHPGDKINWDKETRKTSHVECPKQQTQAAQETQSTEPAPAPFKLSEGSGYGGRGWEVGTLVHTNDRQQERGVPEWVIVVRTGKRYYSEDGMSFGVGDDRGYIYWAECRAATEAEYKPAAEQRAKSIADKARAEELAAELNNSYNGDTQVTELPERCTSIWAEHRAAGSESWELAPDGTVYFYRSDYDMGPLYWRTTATLAQIEEAKSVGLRPNLLRK